MTEHTTPTTTEPTNRTMNDVSHTNPKTGRPFGERVVFARGPTVAADGGERSDGSRSSSVERSESDGGERSDGSRTTADGTSAGSEPNAERAADDTAEDADDEAADRMEDVDHEPPSETAANPVFERGREGRDDAR
ncbi:hypothetical protein [Halococcus agarilyticus]|uniref:hypothetical protein n=1 Tax=Halococcus agarilyticus TaxID=1232219 RepID=UPI0006776BBE|nr:hypothetical protein [Halococcus agarilyticus]